MSCNGLAVVSNFLAETAGLLRIRLSQQCRAAGHARLVGLREEAKVVHHRSGPNPREKPLSPLRKGSLRALQCAMYPTVYPRFSSSLRPRAEHVLREDWVSRRGFVTCVALP